MQLPKPNRQSTLLVSLTLCAACIPKVSRETPLVAMTENVSVNTSQASILMFEHTRNVSVLIESEADRIIRETDDPLLERRALEWKAYAIPAVHEAGLQPDPIVAMMDVWIFGEQMARYFRSGYGRGRLGPFQSDAVETSVRIVESTRELAQAMTYSGETPAADSIAQVWADEHPLDNHFFARQSVITEWAYLAQGGAAEITDVLGRVELGLDEVIDRLALHNEYLLKQLRWSLELVASDIMERPGVDSALTTVTTALEAIKALTDSAPELLRDEVDLVLSTLREELDVLNDLERQRLETLDHLVAERDTVLAVLAAERELILEAVTAERMAAIAELDSVLQHSVLLLSEDLIDRMFGRVLQLIAVALAVAVILSLLVVLVLRRRAVTR